MEAAIPDGEDVLGLQEGVRTGGTAGPEGNVILNLCPDRSAHAPDISVSLPCGTILFTFPEQYSVCDAAGHF